MISDKPIAPSIPGVPTVSTLIGCGCEGLHHCPCFYLGYKLQGVSSMNEAGKASKVMKCMLSKGRPTQNCSLFSPASQAFWVSVTLPMLIFFFSRVLFSTPPLLTYQCLLLGWLSWSITSSMKPSLPDHHLLPFSGRINYFFLPRFCPSSFTTWMFVSAFIFVLHKL